MLGEFAREIRFQSLPEGPEKPACKMAAEKLEVDGLSLANNVSGGYSK